MRNIDEDNVGEYWQNCQRDGRRPVSMISIIIPVFNAEAYLEDCFHSILLQSRADWEAVVVDDGSTDDSYNIMQAYKEKYPEKFIIVRQSNQGQIIARKEGILHARGDYCIFLDADDFIKENAIEIIENKLEKYCCDILIFDAFRVQGDTLSDFWPAYKTDDVVFEGPGLTEFYDEVIKSDRFNTIWCRAFKRELLVEGIEIEIDNSSRIRYEEDLLMQLKFFDLAERIAYIPEKLYFYRYNPKSVLNSFIEDRYYAAGVVNNLRTYYGIKWNVQNFIDTCDQSYFDEVYFSVKQLIIHNVDIRAEGKEYIRKISYDEYFIEKWDHRKCSLSGNRRLMLFLIRKRKVSLVALILDLYRLILRLKQSSNMLRR